MAETDLFDALQSFFDVCLAALAGTPGGTPDCSYISEGPPSWDSCPCLVAWSGGPVVGDTFPLQPSLSTMHRVEKHGQVNLVPLTAIALRCSPTLTESGTLPSPEEHQQAAQELYGDVWALWNHLVNAKRHGILFPPREAEFSIEPGVVYNPQGGAAAAQVTVRFQIDGYDPFAS